MAVSKRTRFEVLRRDNHTCRYCGGRTPDVVLTVDHVVPTTLGGSDDPSNLVAACKDCNAGKSASNPDAPLVAQVADDAIRWAAAMRMAANTWLARRAEVESYCTAVSDRWDRDNNLFRWGRAWLPDDWTSTVERWCSLGMPVEAVTDAVAIAMRSKGSVSNGDVWRYACGIVWKRHREFQAVASGSLATTPASEDDELDDAYQQGLIDSWRSWYYSFERVQTAALVSVVDGPDVLVGRPC